MLTERQRHRSAEVLDRRDLFEDVLETGGGRDGVVSDFDGLGDAVLPRFRSDEPVEAVGLESEQVGNLERSRIFANEILLGGLAVLVLSLAAANGILPSASPIDALPPHPDRLPIRVSVSTPGDDVVHWSGTDLPPAI